MARWLTSCRTCYVWPSSIRIPSQSPLTSHSVLRICFVTSAMTQVSSRNLTGRSPGRGPCLVSNRCPHRRTATDERRSPSCLALRTIVENPARKARPSLLYRVASQIADHDVLPVPPLRENDSSRLVKPKLLSLMNVSVISRQSDYVIPEILCPCQNEINQRARMLWFFYLAELKMFPQDLKHGLPPCLWETIL